MKSIKFIVPVFVVLVISFTSCHKKETVEVDNETQSVVDNAIAEQEFMAVIPAVNGVAIKTKGTGAENNRPAAACDSLRLVSGDTLYSSPTHVHPTYSLSFANTNCTPIPDAKLREGVMFITLYGKIKTPNSRMKFIMQNYKAANIDPTKKISYTCDSIIVKTISSNTVEREFNIIIYKGKCVGPAGNWTTSYSTNRFIRHNFATDDVQIWGTSEGVNREGRKFNVVVDATAPLIKHAACQFISYGILKLTPEGFKERRVDYSKEGNDVCDDQATFSVNGSTVPFTLK